MSLERSSIKCDTRVCSDFETSIGLGGSSFIDIVYFGDRSLLSDFSFMTSSAGVKLVNEFF